MANAILTNVLTKAWSGMTTGEYKRHKGLTKENLRDNMIGHNIERHRNRGIGQKKKNRLMPRF